MSVQRTNSSSLVGKGKPKRNGRPTSLWGILQIATFLSWQNATVWHASPGKVSVFQVEKKRPKHAEFANPPCSVGQHSVESWPTLHVMLRISSVEIRRHFTSKMAENRGKSAVFVRWGLQNNTLRLKIESWELKVIACDSGCYKTAFDLSAFLCSGVEKCHRDDFKRFWRVCQNSGSKQNG